jgi:hypothetical protein
MFIARWHFTGNSGKLDDCISLLRKWEMDVGSRVGWKSSSVRIVTGFIGGSETDIELEAPFENLNDLEGAFSDMDRNPHHKEILKQLAAVTVAGSSRWTLHREMSLV